MWLLQRKTFYDRIFLFIFLQYDFSYTIGLLASHLASNPLFSVCVIFWRILKVAEPILQRFTGRLWREGTPRGVWGLWNALNVEGLTGPSPSKICNLKCWNDVLGLVLIVLKPPIFRIVIGHEKYAGFWEMRKVWDTVLNGLNNILIHLFSSFVSIIVLIQGNFADFYDGLLINHD